MKTQTSNAGVAAASLKRAISVAAIGLLAACANYAGIHGDQQMVQAQQLGTARSLPQEQGRWPSADWFEQFGDTQLKALVAEALQSSPTLDQARARVAAAQAYSETAKSRTLPRVDADYTLTRQQYSSTALVPPPYAGSWQTENKGLLSASYDLDLWGKNREALREAVSQQAASKADAEVVKLTLETSIARTYNELARLYALRDIAQQEVARREQIDRITAGRIATGLDTEVERKTAQANLATSRANVSALDGSILTTRYQLAALLGKGPDRGLAIARPALGAGDEVRLPDNLPADLLSRRPDIVAARWRVDGPAIHLPIFDAGALRAQLKGRYADFDYAVATYNQTLISALSGVATQLAQIHSSDAQLGDAQAAQQAARDADRLATVQYQAGLTNQLTVLNADVTAFNADEAIVNLQMTRRDQQIELASSLGGGYVDDPASSSSDAAASLPAPPQADRQPKTDAALPHRDATAGVVTASAEH